MGGAVVFWRKREAATRYNFDSKRFDYANAVEELWINLCNTPEDIYDLKTYASLDAYLRQYSLRVEDFYY